MSLFTDEEYKQLIFRACEEGGTEQQVFWFLQQCEEMKFQATLLQAILSGNVEVSNITKDHFSVRALMPAAESAV